MNKRKNNVMYILIPLLLAGAGLLLITDSEGVFNAASSAISTCLNVVIPSLFSFMVFSVFLVKSGFGERLFRPLYVINKFWFKGDEKLFAVFMLSLFGGYPVGVKLLSEITAQNKNYSAISSIMLSPSALPIRQGGKCTARLMRRSQATVYDRERPHGRRY